MKYACKQELLVERELVTHVIALSIAPEDRLAIPLTSEGLIHVLILREDVLRM